MRLLLLTLCLFALPALAATPVDKTTANNYYKNCIAKPAPVLTPDSQELMCACTAAKLTENLTIEDMQTMTGGGDGARLALNKMIITVYAPCMAYPAYDYHYQQCIENPDTQKLSKNPTKLCDCMAGQIADYMEANGQQVFTDILQRDPNIYDPMNALMSDPAFAEYAQGRLIACYTESR